MKKVRKHYSLVFKIGAVSLSEQRGNISSVTGELGICNRVWRPEKTPQRREIYAFISYI